MQTFKFSELTPASFMSIVTLDEKGVTPELWNKMNASLTRQERQQVKVVISSLLNQPVILMNEATIWSRAIYPLLMLAEQGSLSAWAQLPLKAQYRNFRLEGVADGVLGDNISGVSRSFYLVVIEAKRGLDAQNPQVQLYGAMLAAARLNWERNGEAIQEIFGCYTIADNWTFVQGSVSDLDADRPAMTIALSREYAEKIEAEAIFRILKFITGKYAQRVANAA